jgi:hypothetical protein
MLAIMKTCYLFALIIIVMIGSCTRDKKSSLEGTWKIVEFGKWHITDTSTLAMINNGLMKSWSKEHFVFVGYFRPDTSIHEYYGGGTYTLDGDKYEEYIIYNDFQPLIGTKFKALLEIRNDTLIQRYNSDKADSWQLRKEFTTEKYVRLK